MNGLITFIRESIDEMRHKVTWPGLQDLQRSSLLVLLASLIFALLIGVVDYGFDNVMKFFYEAF